MPIILDSAGFVYRPLSYETEAEFEAKVVSAIALVTSWRR